MERKGSGDSTLFGLPPRPGSAIARPGTASTRSVGLGQTPYNDESKSSSAIIKNQISGDSLLRILEEKQTSLANEALLFAETGNHVGIKAMVDRGEDLVSIKGMDDYSVLHHACNRGHAAVVNELLRASFPTSCTRRSDNQTVGFKAIFVRV
jgi:ankyrin repeat protein